MTIRPATTTAIAVRRRRPAQVRPVPVPNRRRTQSTALVRAPAMSRNQYNTARYIAGLAKHEIDLPLAASIPCNLPQPYRDIIVKAVFEPVVATDGRAYMVFNPHLGWASNFAFQNGNTTADVIPTMGMPNGSAASFIPSQQPAVTGWIGTSSNDTWSGQVRFMGGSAKFRSTTTMLNTGGKLYFVHNPQDLSLIQAGWNQATGAVQFVTNTPSAVLGNPDMTAMVCVEPGVHRFALLPHTTEFEDLETSATADVQTSAASGYSSVLLEKYVPHTFNHRSHFGWNKALVYEPAETIAAGDSAKCRLTLYLHYHVNVVPDDLSAGAPAINGLNQLNRPGVANPVDAAAVNAALATIKQQRSVQPDQAIATPSSKEDHGPVREVVEAVAEVAKPIATAVDAVVKFAGPIISRFL